MFAVLGNFGGQTKSIMVFLKVAYWHFLSHEEDEQNKQKLSGIIYFNLMTSRALVTSFFKCISSTWRAEVYHNWPQTFFIRNNGEKVLLKDLFLRCPCSFFNCFLLFFPAISSGPCGRAKIKWSLFSILKYHLGYHNDFTDLQFKFKEQLRNE